MKPPLQLEIWSDIACPWCWVGKANLQAALADTNEKIEVSWRAFELNPQAPQVAPQTVDYVDRLASKYQTSREQAQGFIDRMITAGAHVGLEFRFDRIRPSNTFDAHRLLAWSKQFGLQSALKERLFRAYMNEGLAISDASTLGMLAADVGLSPEDADVMLASNVHADNVRDDQKRARSLGISGVPFFLFQSQLGMSGAQPPETLSNAIAQARNLAAEPPSSNSETPAACSADSCND